MRALVIVPARGGSKGLPGKNLREVGGLCRDARVCPSDHPAAQTLRVHGDGALRWASPETRPGSRKPFADRTVVAGVGG